MKNIIYIFLILTIGSCLNGNKVSLQPQTEQTKYEALNDSALLLKGIQNYLAAEKQLIDFTELMKEDSEISDTLKWYFKNIYANAVFDSTGVLFDKSQNQYIYLKDSDEIRNSKLLKTLNCVPCIKGKWKFVNPNDPDTIITGILKEFYFYNKIYNPEKDWNFKVDPILSEQSAADSIEISENEIIECEVNPTSNVNNNNILDLYFRKSSKPWIGDTVHFCGAYVYDLGHDCMLGGKREVHPIHYLWRIRSRDKNRNQITYEVFVFNERKVIRLCGFSAPPYAGESLKYTLDLPFPEAVKNAKPGFSEVSTLSYCKEEAKFKIISKGDKDYLKCSFNVGSAKESKGFYCGTIELYYK